MKKSVDNFLDTLGDSYNLKIKKSSLLLINANPLTKNDDEKELQNISSTN